MHFVSFAHNLSLQIYSVNCKTSKVITTIELDEQLISEYALQKCLEFLYINTVVLGSSEKPVDEIKAIAELFHLAELYMICESSRENGEIELWLQNKNRLITKHLFLNQLLFSDTRFLVEGRVIHAHRVVLLARCSALYLTFRSGFAECQLAEVS